MTVRALLDAKRPAFSFEFFPPKTEQGEKALFETVRSMKDLDPAFVSVTCGAGGSTRGKTLQWAQQIKHDVGIEAVVHMTCLGQTRESLGEHVAEARSQGIENILALRGDPPRGDLTFTVKDGACRYAIDLIRIVARDFPEACVIGACYPEGHTDAESRDMDMRRLKEKCDAGLDVLITQLFFDNGHYFSFVERARAAGIEQPVIPGIMPVTDLSQVERFVKMCGATMPPSLVHRLQGCKDKDEVLQVGVDHATQQCAELIEAGAPGVHFYTLNKSPATRMVVESL